MKFLWVCLLLLARLESAEAQVATVTKITIYKKFLRAGTTAMLTNAFRSHHYADTSNVNADLFTTDVFTHALTSAKKTRHHQMKVGGIRFAGEMVLNGQQHFYVYCAPYLLIDLTARLNYQLDSSQAIYFNNKSKQLLSAD